MRSPEEVDAAIASLRDMRRRCVRANRLDLAVDIERGLSILEWFRNENDPGSFGDLLSSLTLMRQSLRNTTVQ